MDKLNERLKAMAHRLEQLQSQPENGPRILFFSGGTALREACSELVRHTWNSIHVVTPFDSGGSSAALRQEFSMPAVGDARNRLLALAAPDDSAAVTVANFLGLRLGPDNESEALRNEVRKMAEGKHESVVELPNVAGETVRRSLDHFLTVCSDSFDFRNASIGNLVLTSLYLQHERCSAPAFDEFGSLVKARGTVRLVLDEPLDLVAEYDDGRTVTGQHRITGKEVDPIKARVERLHFIREGQRIPRSEVRIDGEVRALISEADLICYPVGSFYTSIVASLLPAGVSDAIASNGCPKIFVPNLGLDPELFGTKLSDQVTALIAYLRRGAIVKAGGTYLDAVLLDSGNAHYPGGVDKAFFEALGLEIVKASLLDSERGLVAPSELAQTLLGLAC